MVAFAAGPKIVKIGALHPVVRGRVSSLFNELEKECPATHRPVLSSTSRSPQEHLHFFEVGRVVEKDTLAGGLLATQVGKTLTSDLPWDSAHVFRLAADIGLVELRTSSWAPVGDGVWDILGALAEKHSLRWNKFRPEHVELEGWQTFVGRDAINRVRELWQPGRQP